MGASIAKIVLRQGAPAALHFPACGAAVYVEDPTEYVGEVEYCRHLLAVYDWVDIFTPGPEVDEALANVLEDVTEDARGSYSEVAQALAEKLQDSDLVVHIREDARGGGHDGSDFVAAFRFPVAGEVEDDRSRRCVRSATAAPPTK